MPAGMNLVGIESTNRFTLDSSNQIFHTIIKVISQGKYMDYKTKQYTLILDGIEIIPMHWDLF